MSCALIEGCLTCDSAGCKKCIDGYYLDGKKCGHCGDKFEHCGACTTDSCS